MKKYLLAILLVVFPHCISAQFQFITLLNDTGIHVTDINVINEDSIYVCSAKKILRSTDGGASWDTLMSPTTFYNADFYDFNNGFAVSPLGYIIRTANGGLTWDTVPNIPTSTFFYDVHMNDPLIAIVSADCGHIFTIYSSGYDVDTLFDAFSGGAPMVIKDFDFDSPSTGFGGGVVSGHSGLARTVDGGISWDIRTTSGFLDLRFDEISSIDSLQIWGIEVSPSPWEHISYSVDGGDYWFSGYPNFSTAKISSIDFLPNGFGLIAKPLEILVTIDSGITWNTLISFPPSFSGLTKIKIVNDTLAYVGGNDAIYKISHPFAVGLNEYPTPFSQLYYAHPNPASDLIVIGPISDNKGRHLLFYDLLGRVEFQEYLENGTDFVDVSSLKSGMYILSIEEPNGRIAKLKIMKI